MKMSWKTVKLGEVCEKIISGGTPDTENINFWNGNIPWITSADIKDNKSINPRKFISQKAIEESAANILPEGNVLVVTRVGLGKIVTNETPVSFSQDIQGLILKKSIDRKYLVYGLSKGVERFKEIGRGATIKGVTRKDLEALEIPLPPLSEQKRMAAILDQADELRQKDRQLLKHYDQLIQSTFHEMFGEINELKKLEDVTIKITDGVHAKPNYTISGIPFISVKNITSYHLNFNNCQYISLEDHYIYTRRCKPELGDILYSKVGATYGRACIVDTEKEFSIYVSVALIKPDRRKILPKFLSTVLNTDAIKQQADRSVKGAGVPDLHLIEIKKIRIPVPEILLQEKYVNIITEIEKQKEIIQQQSTASEALFQSLLSKAFAGEL